MKKAIIIAAGSVFDIKSDGSEFIIAADGGYDAAVKASLKVNLFVGDMDSVKGQIDAEEIITLNTDKNFTDTEYAVNEAKRRGYFYIDIYGATGTRLDHTLSNIFMMKKYLNEGVFIKIKDKNNEMLAINKDTSFSGLFGKTVSFIPADTKVYGVTLQGFKYPLNDADIEIGSTLTVSNIAQSDNVKVKIKSGTLIMIIAQD